VVAFALLVAIALGYAKFVRSRSATSVVAAGDAATTVVDDAHLAGLAERVAALEKRATAAAAALGGQEGDEPPNGL
jgi:hypothetical protein